MFFSFTSHVSLAPHVASHGPITIRLSGVTDELLRSIVGDGCMSPATLRLLPFFGMYVPAAQGALRRVAAEVEVQVKELMALLKEQVVAQRPDAVECIGLIRRLGGPVADLQVACQSLNPRVYARSALLVRSHCCHGCRGGHPV